MVVERDEHGFDAPVALGHPARAGLPAGHSTGPEIGEKLPGFTLPDAHGRPVGLNADREEARAVVVFIRSVVW